MFEIFRVQFRDILPGLDNIYRKDTEDGHGGVLVGCKGSLGSNQID